MKQILKIMHKMAVFQNVTGSWKTYLVGTKEASGQSNQTIQIVFQCQFLLHILIKQILSFVAVKFETYNSFLLGDMVVFIPLGRCAQKVGFPRSGHKYGHIILLKCVNKKLIFVTDGLVAFLIAQLCMPIT